MNRKNKKRAFVTSMIMLLISAIVLTSSTFAWFVMGDKAIIEDMDLKLYAPEGIQISANANEDGWTQMLTLDNLFNTDDTKTSPFDAYVGNKNMYPELLVPASSAFSGFTAGLPNFFNAKVAADGSSTITQIVEASDGADQAGIVAFDIFIKSNTAISKIDFSNSTIEEITEEGGTPTNSTSAIRYAFVKMGNAAATTAPATLQQLSGGTDYYGAEAESYKHTTQGIAAGATTGTAYETKGVTSASDSTADTTKYIFESNVAATNGIVKSDDAANKYFSLDAGVTKFRVYIWAEGNDIDCREVISGSELSVKLMLEIPEAA